MGDRQKEGSSWVSSLSILPLFINQLPLVERQSQWDRVIRGRYSGVLYEKH